MVTKKHLSRRTFLHGVGATIALPYLDAMTPAFASAAKPVTRAAFVYTANAVSYTHLTLPTILLV